MPNSPKLFAVGPEIKTKCYGLLGDNDPLLYQLRENSIFQAFKQTTPIIF